MTNTPLSLRNGRWDARGRLDPRHISEAAQQCRDAVERTGVDVQSCTRVDYVWKRMCMHSPTLKGIQIRQGWVLIGFHKDSPAKPKHSSNNTDTDRAYFHKLLSSLTCCTHNEENCPNFLITLVKKTSSATPVRHYKVIPHNCTSYCASQTLSNTVSPFRKAIKKKGTHCDARWQTSGDFLRH